MKNKFCTARILNSMLVLLCLTGCAATHTPVAEPLDASLPTARMRFFGMNGSNIRFYPATTCIPADEKGHVEPVGGIGQAFHSFVGAEANESIGMPATEHSTHRRDALLAREYFKETPIEAERPIVLAMYHAALSHPGAAGVAAWKSGNACNALPGTFVPSAGKDYEVFLDRGECRAVVMDVTTPDAPKPVSMNVSGKCGQSQPEYYERCNGQDTLLHLGLCHMFHGIPYR